MLNGRFLSICCIKGDKHMKTNNSLVQMRKDIFKIEASHVSPYVAVSCQARGAFPDSYMFFQSTIPVVCTNGTVLKSLPSVSGKTDSHS